MEKRTNNAWPMWVPKQLDVEKPTSEYLRDWAAYTPDRTALSFYGRIFSYSELNNLIDRFANGLIKLGLKKGDRVALHMENCPQFVIAYFGAQRAGGVVVPVNPMFKHVEIEYEVNDAGASMLIGDDHLYAEVDKVRLRTHLKSVILTSLRAYLPDNPTLPLSSEMGQKRGSFEQTIDFLTLLSESSERPVCRVDNIKKDLTLLQYTGGTTGTPKGAMITHHALSYACIASMHWFHHREDDVHLGVTPFFHILGQTEGMLTPLISGGTVLVLPRFIADTVALAITKYKVTSWFAATTMFIALLNLPNLRDYDFSSFRLIFTGGTAIPTELQTQMRKLCPNAILTQGYGLSESVGQGGAQMPLYGYKQGFDGLRGISEIRIMDKETGTRQMLPNEEGEITLKGPAIMIGYWNKPEETKEMLRDGWLYTGDIGLMDEEGYVKFLSRSRELIKCSGYSVFPADVEDLLYRHPAVQEAAVIGVNDPYRGEIPKAFIILKQEYEGKITAEEIVNWCKDNMAAYKRPHLIEFRKELPKSAAGKVLKRILVDEEQASHNTIN